MESENYYADKLLKDKSLTIVDDCHIFGITKNSNLKHDVVKENYGEISFSFDFLERIKKIVDAICSGDYEDAQINMMCPKNGDGALIFKIRMPQLHARNMHDDHPDDYVILLAPRKETGQTVYPKLINQEIKN